MSKEPHDDTHKENILNVEIWIFLENKRDTNLYNLVGKIFLQYDLLATASQQSFWNITSEKYFRDKTWLLLLQRQTELRVLPE